MTGCPLRARALATPGAVAVVEGGNAFTYAELDRRAGAQAAALRALGVRPGEVVAVALPNSADAVALLHALWRLRAVAFPMDPRFPADYARSVLERAGCARLVSGANPPAAEVRHHRPEELAAPGATPDEAARVDPHAPATLTLTSGSTGAPKAAAHGLAAHWANAARSNANLPLAPDDRWLLSLSPHHVAGLGVLFRCLAAGAAVVIPAPGLPFGETLAAAGATHLSLVATQLRRAMDDPEGLRALRAAKAILLGGSGMPEALLRAAHAAGLRVHTSYGMTEMATQIATTKPGDPLERWFTSGCPLAAGSLRIAPEGDIEVGGETLFLGYWEAGALRRPLTPDGWFRTGDLGTLDAEGYLRVTGRRDNMFVAGGENVQPEEIESALLRLPGVVRAVVVPAPHGEFGQVPVAFVARESVAPTEASIRAALARDLPRFKVPKQIYAWPHARCGPDDKPRRADFAAWAAAGDATLL